MQIIHFLCFSLCCIIVFLNHSFIERMNKVDKIVC